MDLHICSSCCARFVPGSSCINDDDADTVAPQLPHECKGAVCGCFLHHAEVWPVVDACTSYVAVEGIGVHSVQGIMRPSIPRDCSLISNVLIILLFKHSPDTALSDQISAIQYLRQDRIKGKGRTWLQSFAPPKLKIHYILTYLLMHLFQLCCRNSSVDTGDSVDFARGGSAAEVFCSGIHT